MNDVEISKIGAFDILLNMFLVYNLILHSSIVVINMGIDIKEFSLDIFEMT